MKIKHLQSFLILVLLVGAMTISSSVNAQTAGTLTCTFTTTSTGGYTPKNCIAVWIQNSSNAFVKTKLKQCSSSNYDHLATWTGISGQNTTDATVGSTRTSNGSLTITWNGTNVSGNVVTDGNYTVWVEFSWASSLTTGKTVQSFTFTKGTTTDHQAPANTTNITGISLDWVPLGVGIADNQEKSAFTVSPNPVDNSSMIKYSLTEMTDVTLSVYDVDGKLVKMLLDENQAAGNYNISLSLNVAPGVYFLKMYTGKTQHTEKIVISK